MTVVNTTTGEIIDFDRAAAERRAERITLRLDAIADNYAAVMPMIRESIEKQDHLALGYRSVGEYVADRFGGSLQHLGVEVRRAVVGELAAAGMTTRAIAPVIGVSHMTVARDQSSGVTGVTPDPTVSSAPVDGPAAEAVSDDEVPEPKLAGADDASDAIQPERASADTHTQAPAPRTVTGIDGKTYTRPERKVPRPAAEKTLNIIGLYAGKAARAAADLTPEQIRRIRPEADAWTVGLRQNVEALQRLIDSLDN